MAKKVLHVSDGKPRCPWALRTPLETEYHDTEWGQPCFDDQKLFEYLVLDTFQAGLSWAVVMQKREGFRKAFYGFNAEVMAAMPDAELDMLLMNPAIIRNRLKVYASRKNALAYLKLKETRPGGLVDIMWKHVEGKPLVNHFEEPKQVPAKTEISDRMAKELTMLGFGFCGSVTIYAMMQAAGMVNDHLISCHCHPTYLSGL